MGEAKIAFNSAKSYEALGIYMDSANRSIMISVPAGTNMQAFAPAAIELARFYSDMSVFIDIAADAQLKVLAKDTPGTLQARYLTLSPFKKTARSSKAGFGI